MIEALTLKSFVTNRWPDSESLFQRAEKEV
jgi:hypothetical protein